MLRLMSPPLRLKRVQFLVNVFAFVLGSGSLCCLSSREIHAAGYARPCRDRHREALYLNETTTRRSPKKCSVLPKPVSSNLSYLQSIIILLSILYYWCGLSRKQINVTMATTELIAVVSSLCFQSDAVAFAGGVGVGGVQT